MLINIAITLAVIYGLLMVLVWKLGGLGKGRKFGSKIAKHLGMSNNFFHTVLENGVSGSSLQLLAILERTGWTPARASIELAPSLERGLIAMENRFGRQEMIDNAKLIVVQILKEWETLQKRPDQ